MITRGKSGQRVGARTNTRFLGSAPLRSEKQEGRQGCVVARWSARVRGRMSRGSAGVHPDSGDVFTCYPDVFSFRPEIAECVQFFRRCVHCLGSRRVESQRGAREAGTHERPLRIPGVVARKTPHPNLLPEEREQERPRL